ncbi:MAG: hypothetical protein ACFFCL_16430, partial [Promethearchaeota archaeon]
GLPSPYNYFLWPLILIVIAVVLLFIIVKYVILPRTGIAKPGPSLKSMRKKLFIAIFIQLAIHIVLIFLLVIGSGSGIHVEGITFILIVGLFIMPIFGIIAYLMKYSRLYLIGMLIWLGIFINELLHDFLDYKIRYLLSYGITGTIIFFIGLIIFIRFLKKYPLQKGDSMKNV